MAQWRKVLVSGSSADVSSLSVGTANGTAGTIVNNSSIAGSRITGSFTGSFVGDGSDLTGITATSLDIDNFGSDLTSATLAVSDIILVSDGGTDGRANIGDLATPLAGTGLEANANTIRIAAAAAGDGLSGGAGNALALDLNELTAADVDVSADSIAIIDANDSNASKKESIADFVDGINGTGIAASSGQLSVAAAQTSITSIINSSLGKIGTAADQEYLKFDTSNEVNVHINDTERLSVTANGADLTGNLVVSAHISASLLSGSFYGDGSNLTGVAQDIDTLTELDATPHATQDEFLISDNGTEKRISMTNVANGVFAIASDSDDATIGADGGITINANVVEGTMLNTNAADTTTLELSSDTLSVLKVPNDLTVDNATIALNSGTTFNGSGARTISVKDGGIDEDAIATSIAGTGIDGGGGSALSINANQTFTTLYNTGLIIGRAANDTTINFTTDDQIVFDVGSTEALKLTTSGVTVAGNLVVNGSTTTISSTNLAVGDQFIFIATGSAGSNVDGGIIVQEGSNADTGSALYHDTTSNRWSVAKDIKAADTAVTPLESVVTVKELGDNDAPVDGDKEYGAGEMAINSNGTIWIYS
tara:strand:- start:1935 stop:3725 length:1791 start_codon:yes stop_codon:yes gene_type:complete